MPSTNGSPIPQTGALVRSSPALSVLSAVQNLDAGEGIALQVPKPSSR